MRDEPRALTGRDGEALQIEEPRLAPRGANAVFPGPLVAGVSALGAAGRAVAVDAAALAGEAVA